MKNLYAKIINSVKNLSKKQIIWGVLVLLIVSGIVSIILSGGGVQTIVLAERGTIEEEVLVTGKTKSSAEVNLGFEKSGRVVSSNLSVGARVYEGQTIAVLDQSASLADLRKAEAKLNEELVGLSTTERESGVSYQNAYNSLSENVRDAYAKADDAVRNNVDRFFTNPRDYNALFDPTFTDGGSTYYLGVTDEARRTLGASRVEIEGLLTSWSKMLDVKSEADLVSKESIAETNLRTIRDFLDRVALEVNSIKSIDYTHDSTVQGYKNTVSTARSEVMTALTNLIAAKDKFNIAPKSISTNGQASYDEVLQSQARVESLKADVEAIKAELSKQVLTSPIEGVITKMDAKRGEIVTAGTPLVSIISDTKLQIEANVSEVNIDKVHIGNTVSITFDAMPGRVFQGRVTYIDPAAAIVDNVPTYKVTVSIDEGNEDIRSGLTANLRIQTAMKENVVKVPAYAVERQGDRSFVMVKTGKNDKVEKTITIGLRGKDGTLEVVSGLEGREELVVTK